MEGKSSRALGTLRTVDSGGDNREQLQDSRSGAGVSSASRVSLRRDELCGNDHLRRTAVTVILTSSSCLALTLSNPSSSPLVLFLHCFFVEGCNSWTAV